VLERIETAVLAKYGISRGTKAAEAAAAAPAKGKEAREAPAGPPSGDTKRAAPPKAN
jgi:hypothetical protein